MRENICYCWACILPAIVRVSLHGCGQGLCGRGLLGHRAGMIGWAGLSGRAGLCVSVGLRCSSGQWYAVGLSGHSLTALGHWTGMG